MVDLGKDGMVWESVEWAARWWYLVPEEGWPTRLDRIVDY